MVNFQAGDPGELMVYLQYEAWQAADLGRAIVSVQAQRQEESQCRCLKAVKQEEFSHIQGRVSLFVLFKASTDWIRPIHITKGNLL